MKNKLQEQIRAFHLTGSGLEEFAPETPLRPVALADADPQSLHLQDDFAPFRDVYTKAMREQRGQARQRFIENVKYRRDRLQEILSLDDNRDPTVAQREDAVVATMGRASAFFDSGSLAAILQTVRDPVARMEVPRRKRCESALAILNEFLHEAGTQPLFWEFPAADAGAIAFCERQLDAMAATFRAVRVADLEIASAYDPAIHDETLARFTWESADPEELVAMPAIVVVDTVERVEDASLSFLHQLLRTGLPMQILLTCPHFYTGDLAFLAVAHQEAFVMQSAVSCPEHLEEGMLHMTHTLRPAVGLISTADPAIFHQSGVFPLYIYDPECGDDWFQKFRLIEPAMPNANAAHVAATSTILAGRHFRVLPKDCWSTEQAELAQYLKDYVKQPPLSIPYILVLDEKGAEHRAILTRELALIARDRIKASRLLTEIAEAGKPQPPVVDTNKVREDAAREASRDTILKVVGMLTGGGGPVVSTAAASAPASPVQETSAAPVQTADPYIDSTMCTSCNDCMKVNSRMFLYNADKQAYLGDTSVGTFAELVKAAEGCPARCIHPGSPRPGDRTATSQLVARAAKFNN